MTRKHDQFAQRLKSTAIFCQKKLQFEIPSAQPFPGNGNIARFCYRWKAVRSSSPDERLRMIAKTLTSGQSSTQTLSAYDLEETMEFYGFVVQSWYSFNGGRGGGVAIKTTWRRISPNNTNLFKQPRAQDASTWIA